MHICTQGPRQGVRSGGGGGPMSTLVKVVKERNSASLHWLLCLMNTINGSECPAHARCISRGLSRLAVPGVHGPCSRGSKPPLPPATCTCTTFAAGPHARGDWHDSGMGPQGLRCPCAGLWVGPWTCGCAPLPLTCTPRPAGLWFAYGLAIKDWFITIPNGVGAVFNIICLVSSCPPHAACHSAARHMLPALCCLSQQAQQPYQCSAAPPPGLVPCSACVSLALIICWCATVPSNHGR